MSEEVSAEQQQDPGVQQQQDPGVQQPEQVMSSGEAEQTNHGETKQEGLAGTDEKAEEPTQASEDDEGAKDKQAELSSAPKTAEPETTNAETVQNPNNEGTEQSQENNVAQNPDKDNEVKNNDNDNQTNAEGVEGDGREDTTVSESAGDVGRRESTQEEGEEAVEKEEEEIKGDRDESGRGENANGEQNVTDDEANKSDVGVRFAGAEKAGPDGDDQEHKTEDRPRSGTAITTTSRGSPLQTPATQIRADNKRLTTTPADDSGLVQPLLPAIPRGQVKVDQIASSISRARRQGQEENPPTVHPFRARVPPKLVRLATVTVSPAKSRAPHKGPSLYYEEPRRPQKVISWEQAHNARPPLRVDMEGPGPCTYSPNNKPLMETNAPSYTFGTKCVPEKAGGARTSWGKSWFQSDHLWHNKADYVREGLWPSPNHYPKASLLGPRQRTLPEAPSFTFGHKQAFSVVKPGAEKEPSPNDYERQNADRLILKRGPSFTHQFRREGTVLWGSSESNPGPAAYSPLVTPKKQKPAFTIQGIRREKSHILGPYSTI